MTYNVFGGTLNPAQSNPIENAAPSLVLIAQAVFRLERGHTHVHIRTESQTTLIRDLMHRSRRRGITKGTHSIPCSRCRRDKSNVGAHHHLGQDETKYHAAAGELTRERRCCAAAILRRLRP